MKSETFLCPHCKVMLTKTLPDQVAGDYYISSGSPTQRCPACSGVIERKSIRAGEYDPKPKACFVATAVYLDANCMQVEKLRLFRDHVLADSVLGRAFISVYYRVGPFVASHVARKPRLSRVARFALDRVVAHLREE